MFIPLMDLPCIGLQPWVWLLVSMSQHTNVLQIPTWRDALIDLFSKRYHLSYPSKTHALGASCYTKILSPSCDKNFDIPTCPKSQLLEWKLMVVINLSWKFPALHFLYCLGEVPCSHCLSHVSHKRCHCLWPFIHKHFLPEPLCHWRRNVVP